MAGTSGLNEQLRRKPHHKLTLLRYTSVETEVRSSDEQSSTAHKVLRNMCLVWRGVAIREDKYQDSEGMCLRCFYKILSQRYQTQRRSALR